MIYAVYPYGSIVYGTRQEFGDLDLIVVSDCKEDFTAKEAKQVKELLGVYPHTQLDVNHYTLEEFSRGIGGHEISFLECIFLPNALRLPVGTAENVEFKLSLTMLRESISKKASNSWVKAKKKLIIPEDRDEYIAKKSLFHSLRILKFGQQLAKSGKITDFAEANSLWDEIQELPADWTVLEEKFKLRYNEEASKFKALAPKSLLPRV